MGRGTERSLFNTRLYKFGAVKLSSDNLATSFIALVLCEHILADAESCLTFSGISSAYLNLELKNTIKGCTVTIAVALTYS